MRIAFLGGYLSRRASGVREVVEHLSRGLVERGHEVRVFGLENADWRQGDCDRWKGAPATIAPVHGPRAMGYAPGWCPELRAFAPEIVHLHGLWLASAAVAANWARKYTTGALVVSPHGMLSEVALSYSRRRKRIIRMLYQDRCFAAADLYHATSHAEAEQIENYGLAAPVTVIPNGLEDMPLHLRDAEAVRERSVVTLGRLHTVKGVDRLLRAWARIEADFPSWRLRIVGADAGDGYGAHLAAQASALRLERVEFPGAIFGDDKWRVLLGAEIFVLPTESENFALTVPEALLAGLPVVSTDGAPWAALEREGCGWLVPRTDESVAGTLAQAMRLSPGERRAMGAKGRKWVLRDFRWPVIAERFEESYARALTRRGSLNC